jgi:hypothetical protein
MVPLAHLGHLIVDIPIFLGPVFLIVLALFAHTWWARRHSDRQEAQ